MRVDDLRRLPGGAGYNWTDGRVVLKPVGNVPEHNWVCQVFAGWDAPDVRVPEPVAPTGQDGADWSVDAATLELVHRLLDALAPVAGHEQPVHGDLLPNVLAADGLALAVIDWPVYFRPPAWALAIAATDAVTFRDAPMSLLDDWESGPDWAQLLVRSLLYRLGPTGFIASRSRLMGSLVTHVERARPVVDAVLARLRT